MQADKNLTGLSQGYPSSGCSYYPPLLLLLQLPHHNSYCISTKIPNNTNKFKHLSSPSLAAHQPRSSFSAQLVPNSPGLRSPQNRRPSSTHPYQSPLSSPHARKSLGIEPLASPNPGQNLTCRTCPTTTSKTRSLQVSSNIILSSPVVSILNPWRTLVHSGTKVI